MKAAEFVEKADKIIGKQDASLKDVKATIEALSKLNFSLVDSKILGDALASMVENLSRLIDSRKVAEDTQRQVNVLAFNVKNLEVKMQGLNEQLRFLRESFDELERRLTFDAESERIRREKLGVVLESLEQYLRRHV